MEHGWVITVEVAGDAGEITDDGLAALMDELADRGGAVSGQPGRYSATFNMHPNEGDQVEDVVRVGTRVFTAAAHRVGLPSWPVARLEAMTFAEQDANLARPAFPELVGIKEIAETLAVSPQRAHQLTKRSNFPDPITRLAAGPIWTRPSLERFIDEWRAGKPDFSKSVVEIDALIAQLTAHRNNVVHGRSVPDEIHTTLGEILARAELPHLPRTAAAAAAAVGALAGGLPHHDDGRAKSSR